MPTVDKVAARWLEARQDPLDEKYIQKLRKEFLMLLRNADRAKTFDTPTAEKYRKAVVRWREMFELYGGQIREDLKGRERAAKSGYGKNTKANEQWAHWYLEHMKPFWEMHYELGNVPAVPDLRAGTSGGPFEDPEVVEARLVDFYETRYPERDAKREVERYLWSSPLWTRKQAEADSLERWAESTRKWAARARSKARATWKYLTDLGNWAAESGWYGGGGEAIALTTTQDERVSLEGFSLLFRGFDDAGSNQEYLEALKAALAKYKQKARKHLPLLLKKQLPFVVNWSWAKDHGSAAATYNGDHIEITPWGLTSNTDNMVRTLAHEMGHHLYDILGREKQHFWESALRGDYKKLDLRHAVKVMKSVGASTTISDKLAQKDPILYLQLGTLLNHHGYKGLDLFGLKSIEEYLADPENSPIVIVPASPISAYAGTSASEAFCEAVGHLVAYGKNRLPDKVLGWMKIMLPHVKFGAERLGPNTPLMEHGKVKVKYRVKSSGKGVAVTVYYGRGKIGGMNAFVTKYPERDYCGDDVWKLLKKYPQVEDTSRGRWTPNGGEERTNTRGLQVYKAFLTDESKQGLGIGRAMYLAMMAEWFDKVGPFLFMPMVCGLGTSGTSAAAFRVWKSLARDFPSSGNVIAVLRRPRLPSPSKVAHRFMGDSSLHPVRGISTHDGDGRPLRQPSGLLRMMPDYGEGGANLPRGNPGEVEEVCEELQAMGMRVASRFKQARTYNRIALYDFDGTLFRSWETEPSWWKGTSLDTGPYSFFVRPESLGEPYIPESPGSDYWVAKSVAAAKRDAADRNVLMAVVTGRVGVHKQRVRDLLKSKGIAPQAFYFNPGMDAVRFKVAIIRTLLVSNNITAVGVWENENQTAYKRALEHAAEALGQDIKVTVHSVQVPPKPLVCGPADFGLSEGRVAAYDLITDLMPKEMDTFRIGPLHISISPGYDKFQRLFTRQMAAALQQHKKLLPEMQIRAANVVLVHSRGWGEDLAGDYDDGTIRILFKNSPAAVETALHEIGHQLWDHNSGLRSQWRIFDSVAWDTKGYRINAVASESMEEHFCEAYALVVGGSLRGWRKEAILMAIEGKTHPRMQASRVATRLADRFLSAAAKYQKKKEVPKADGKGTMTVYEYSDGQVQHRNREKAERVEKLRGNLDKLRGQVKKDLKSKDPSTRLSALAVGLMNDTYERVGNAGSAKEGHFGVTVWQAQHVTLGKGKATFSYVGKSGVKQKKVTSDKALISVLREAMKGKSGTDNVFSLDDVSVGASGVNEYLKQFNITAKDIRGLHANREMQTRLKSVRSKGGKLPADKKKRDEKLKAEFKKALEGAAEAVGHEPTTLKGQYLVPGLEDSYIKDGTVMDKLHKKARVALPPSKWVDAVSTELDRAQKEQVWTVYHMTYATIGEHIGSLGQLLSKYKLLWLMDVDGDQEIDAFIAYKKTPFGYKIALGGTDGTRAAVRAFVRKHQELMVRPGWYAEASGKPDKLMSKMGLRPLEDESAVRGVLVGKDIEWGQDGWYTRTLGGLGKVKKRMYGHPIVRGRALMASDVEWEDLTGRTLTGEVVDTDSNVWIVADATGREHHLEDGWDFVRRVATKTPAEREDAEVERLSRKEPKVKPPRKDLRRQRMEVDQEDDPDMKQDKKNQSHNYKDIGASVLSVLERQYKFSAWTVW